MALVPEGEFLMGEERRRLWISAFFIDLAPVTHREYAVFVASTGHPPPEYWRQGEYPPERADHPVVAVSIDDARAFARWRGMAIPTEEEWEKAARGADGRVYPWGDLFSSERANVRGAGIRDTTPVGRFPSGKSPFGCVDMVGNVWEWTETPHDVSGKFLTLKGGSWYDVSSYARCTTRFSARPDYRGSCVGFRCVKRIGGALPRVRVAGPPETRKLDRRDILAAAPAAPPPGQAAPAPATADLGAALRIFDYGEENVLREKLDREYREAAAALEAGRAAAARTALQAILEEDPRHPSAIDLLARIPPDAADSVAPPAPRGLRERVRETLASPRGRVRAMAAAGLLLALVAFAALPGPKCSESADDAGEDVPVRSRHSVPRRGETTLESAPSSPSRRPDRDEKDAPPRSRGATATAPPGMVEVPAGEFPFGAERTMTRVGRFFIDRLEVTNDDYMRFVRAAGHPAPLHWIDGRIPEGQESHPVTFVSYADAAAYASWAGKRLPTEEEWEKAAAGPEGLPYPWGREFEPFRANIMLSLDDIMSAPGLQAVGSFSTGASACGAEDMVGNVLEWTSSWFDPEARRVRVLKGGAWSLGREDGRVTARYGFFSPETRNEVIGFRCAQD